MPPPKPGRRPHPRRRRRRIAAGETAPPAKEPRKPRSPPPTPADSGRGEGGGSLAAVPPPQIAAGETAPWRATPGTLPDRSTSVPAEARPPSSSPAPPPQDSGGGNGASRKRAARGSPPARPPYAALGNGGMTGGRPPPAIAGRGGGCPGSQPPPTPAIAGGERGGAVPPARPSLRLGGTIPPNPPIRSGSGLRRRRHAFAARPRPQIAGGEGAGGSLGETCRRLTRPPPSLSRPQREIRGTLGAQAALRAAWSPRRLWPSGVISASFAHRLRRSRPRSLRSLVAFRSLRRASPGAAAVPSHAHRGACPPRAHAGFRHVLTAPLVTRKARASLRSGRGSVP